MHKYKRGIFIGKFYPFHLGHLASLTKLATVCEKTYLILYASQASEAKIAHQLGYEYGVDQRIADVRDILQEHKNITVVKLDIPKDIAFPDDVNKIQKLVEETIGGAADLQIFGEEEKDIYAPHAYAPNYILGPIYSVPDKTGNDVPLHASLIRNDYALYKEYLPAKARDTLDRISHKSR